MRWEAPSDPSSWKGKCRLRFQSARVGCPIHATYLCRMGGKPRILMNHCTTTSPGAPCLASETWEGSQPEQDRQQFTGSFKPTPRPASPAASTPYKPGAPSMTQFHRGMGGKARTHNLRCFRGRSHSMNAWVPGAPCLASETWEGSQPEQDRQQFTGSFKPTPRPASPAASTPYKPQRQTPPH